MGSGKFGLIFIVGGLGLAAGFPAVCRAAERTCVASDVFSLGACFDKANALQIDAIEIDRLITCDVPRTCAFVLSQRTAPLTIRGKPKSGAGILRRGNYSSGAYQDVVMLFLNSRNVVLRDLVFDDGEDPCDINDSRGLCNSFVAFLPGSANILIDDVSFLRATNLAVQISGVNGLRVRNSVFAKSRAVGLWMDMAEDGIPVFGPDFRSLPVLEERITRFATVENNFFIDTKTAGLNFHAFGTPENPNIARGNLFVHNHWESIYYVCGPNADVACSGGQFTIGRNKNSLVEMNVVKDGRIDNFEHLDAHATGIETSDLLENIFISSNVSANNTGAGLFGDYTTVDQQVKAETVRIIGNKFYGNGYDEESRQRQVYFDGADIRDNCFGSTCPLRVEMGKIYAVPNPCFVDPETGVCSSTVTWRTHDAANVRVVVEEGNGLFGAAPDGTNTASFITELGATFTLYAGTAPLDSVFVKGAKPFIQADPNPCTLAADGKCTSRIFWNAYGRASSVTVKVRETGGTFAAAPSGSQDAPWIAKTPIHLDLYDGAVKIGEVGVYGRSPPLAAPQGLRRRPAR